MNSATPIVLAHRGNIDGPGDAEVENTLPLLLRAVEHGYSVETDFRADGQRLVLSHDPAPWSPDRDAIAFLNALDAAAAATRGPRRVHAFNVKDLDGLRLLLEALDSLPALRQGCFLFDFELALPAPTAQHTMNQAAARARVARRVSDQEPCLRAYLRSGHRLFWCDEFERPYWQAPRLRAIADQRAEMFCVSPDLHGRRDVPALRKRWRAWRKAGATGICTDFANLLAQDLEAQ